LQPNHARNDRTPSPAPPGVPRPSAALSDGVEACFNASKRVRDAPRRAEEGRIMSALDEIRHVVVLVLENQSFDRLLGFLTLPDPTSKLDGLTGAESVPPAPGDPGGPVVVRRVTTPDAYVVDPSPGHSFDDATVQLFARRSVTGTAAPTNDGFALSYAEQPGRDKRPIGARAARAVMDCLDPALVPVISTLARSFVVCDRWFSSVPGPTWPNRFFLHAATANGLLETPETAGQLASQFFTSPYGMRSIFENLADAGHTWKVYFDDYAHAFALRNLHRDANLFQRFEMFATDVQTGALPAYAFIEPRSFSAPGFPANDQHPPHDLLEGERLIAEVYDTLRADEALWRRCLFIVLYDEHGGFYDHVPPPRTIAPDPTSAATRAFAFDRLGVRVPAILVSPWVGAGRADHTTYDHASLPATIKTMFGLPRFLTQRDARANTFEGNLLAAARASTPTNLSALVPTTPRPGAPVDGELSSHQRSLRAIAEVLASRNEPASVDAHARQFLDQPQGP
jgi:phospholipase C